MGDTANEFTGLPMADLIGGPLNAACDAQVRLAKATSDFIRTVGFEAATGSDDKGKLTPRQIDFAFWRPVPASAGAPSSDGASTSASAVTNDVELVKLSVPMLSVVNVPALSVKSVDITFDMEVKTAETSQAASDKSGELTAHVKLGWGPVSADVQIHGSVSTHKEHTRSTDKSAKYHVSVQARDDGMPEGLSRILDIMQSAIAPVAVGKRAGATANGLGTQVADAA